MSAGGCTCGSCTWCKPIGYRHVDIHRKAVECDAMLANLTATQARCTELLEENRDLNARLAKHQALILDLLSWFSSTLKNFK